MIMPKYFVHLRNYRFLRSLHDRVTSHNMKTLKNGFSRFVNPSVINNVYEKLRENFRKQAVCMLL